MSNVHALLNTNLFIAIYVYLNPFGTIEHTHKEVISKTSKPPFRLIWINQCKKPLNSQNILISRYTDCNCTVLKTVATFVFFAIDILASILFIMLKLYFGFDFQFFQWAKRAPKVIQTSENGGKEKVIFRMFVFLWWAHNWANMKKSVLHNCEK